MMKQIHQGEKKNCQNMIHAKSTYGTTNTKSKHIKDSKEWYLLGQDKTSKFSG